MTSVALFAILEYANYLEFLEAKMFDMRVQTRTSQVSGNREIVVVLIDDASIETMSSIVGRWPWPRDLFAELNQFLAEHGAKTVLYDILFSELTSPLDEDGQIGDTDFFLAQSTLENGHVIHAFHILEETQDEGSKTQIKKPLPSDFRKKFALTIDGSKSKFRSKNNYFYLPFAELWKNAAGVGVVEFAPDPDGVYRRTALLRNYLGEFFPILSLSSLIHLFPDRQISVGDHSLSFGDIDIPLLDDYHYLINPKVEYETYSIGGVFATIQQIQNGDLDSLLIEPGVFKNKIVLIGASAVGLEDLKPLPCGPNYPGIFLHASIISNILDRDFIRKVSISMEIIVALILSFIIGRVIIGNTPMYMKASIPLCFVVGFCYTGFFVFHDFQIWISIVFPVSTMFLVCAVSFAYKAFSEGHERFRTKRMFSQFVSPTILSQIIDRKSKLTSEIGSKANVTVVFIDVRKFTSITEKLPAEKVVELLNYYLHEMVRIIFQYDGTLDKFIGDAIMAFWGAPIIIADHVQKAILCAFKMQKKMKEINNYFSGRNLPEIQIGIGINTGQVIVGNVGSEMHLDYTVIGDQVNLASRIEGLTKFYGCPILISENSIECLNSGSIVFRVVDKVQVKGRKKTITLFEPLVVLSDKGALIQIALGIRKMTEVGFRHYQAKEWILAKEAYSGVLNLKPEDMLSKIMMNRCDKFAENPPGQNWNGCYSFNN